MKLYLLTRIDERPSRPAYDYYDSLVVAAPNHKSAGAIRPSGDKSWPSPDYVKVERIGTASARFKEGTIVCASFNAG